ncbi:transferase [Myriangium duriaei CBS 260.36]|uniref:Transferase n=1 Tax=Myriangium duriaei CBS 260.36 TaxID=1168546 RepID=A0A9P4J132_9PEZI|nr:transferase [Myriangium duriaei CBS 260.36]
MASNGATTSDVENSILIECPPFDITLSHWDRIFPPTPSKRILCFQLPQGANKSNVIEHLHIAFHHTVQRVPFLAGRIVPFSEEEGGRPWLRNITPDGAARLDIRDLSGELSFSQLKQANFPQTLLKADKLCTFARVAYVSEDPVDVCCFNATFINGGLLLVVQVMHIAADGRGVSDIIKIFADNLRKTKLGELRRPLETIKTVYKSDRTALVSGNGLTGSLEGHPAFTASPVNTHSFIQDVSSACQTYRISASNLVILKKLASMHLSAGEWISTGDAIAALIWRSIMMARHRAGILPNGRDISLAQPVDFRTHLKIPPPYFGNCLYMTRAATQFSTVANPKSGLTAAAQIIRNDVRSVTADVVRDLLAFSERTEKEQHTHLKIIGEVATSGIILTSHFKFNLHDIDFGETFVDGRIQALRFPEKGTMGGAVIVMPQLPDGGCEFMVSEEMATVSALRDDALFTRFAVGGGDGSE